MHGESDSNERGRTISDSNTSREDVNEEKNACARHTGAPCQPDHRAHRLLKYGQPAPPSPGAPTSPGRAFADSVASLPPPNTQTAPTQFAQQLRLDSVGMTSCDRKLAPPSIAGHSRSIHLSRKASSTPARLPVGRARSRCSIPNSVVSHPAGECRCRDNDGKDAGAECGAARLATFAARAIRLAQAKPTPSSSRSTALHARPAISRSPWAPILLRLLEHIGRHPTA